MLNINFNNIRSLDNSQEDAFEEMVCQLARSEFISKGKRFIRKGKPDAGVECIWEISENVEWGWQAKYFTRALTTTQWNEVEKSVKTALLKHPKLKRYYIAFGVNPSDARIPGQKSMLEKWEEKVKKWTALAKSKGMNVKFIYWGQSELLELLSKKEHEGRIHFWFNQSEFTDQWFFDNINSATQILLNKRYTPALNFELPIAKIFDGLARDHHFKNQLDELFENLFQKYQWAERQLEENKMKRNVSQIISKTKQLKTIYISLDFEGVQLVDFLTLENLIETLLQYCRKHRHYLLNLQLEELKVNPDKYRYSVEPYGGELSDLGKYVSAVHDFQEFLQTITCHLVNSPVLMITGKAGMGKSHLLADIVNDRLAKRYLSIFLLGHHFVTDENPWTQILHSQLRLPLNEHIFLGALNAKAESTQKRIIIFIDAINEGNGKNFWSDYLKNFIETIKRYEWLGLVVSLRSSYEKLIAPDQNISEELIPRIVHTGFAGSEYEATKHFFQVYNIEQPSIPLLEPEFQNPLFLKLLCEGLQNNKLTKLPEGFWGISQVLEFFVNSINTKLSKPYQFDYSEKIDVVYKTIQAIITWKIDNNKRYIPYEQAHLICEEIFRKYCTKGSNYLDVLVSEGVFSEDIFYDISGRFEKGIYLAYERFEDNLQAAALIDKYISIEQPEKGFESGYLYELTKSDYVCNSNQGLVEALSIQLPEKRGKELYELAFHAEAFYHVADAFVESLLWRRSDSCSEKQLEYINKRVLKFNGTINKFWDILIAISIRPDHYFNANMLHAHLLRFSMSDRDKWWTVLIHDKYGYANPVKRIIDWCWSFEDKAYVSKEVAKLTSITLSWFFTSPNRNLRDAATKALVSILEKHVSVIKEVLKAFEEVNDPYVLERVYCGAYGAVLRASKTDGLLELCDFIYGSIFNKDKVYPHILLRDYAREIIEYSIQKGIKPKIDILKIRPPYKSDIPKIFPTNRQLDQKYQIKHGSKKYKQYHGGANEILSSMTTEYGRGTAGYGDFGRYTFQRALSDFKVNPNQWSNWAVDRIFKLGYDVKKHGEFDSAGKYRIHNTSHAERIGKKYQWIALHESLARISDNFPFIDDSNREEKKTIPYNGPWAPSVRDIDPSVLIKKTREEKYEVKRPHWWFPINYQPWAINNKDWMNLKSDFPDPSSIIQVKHDDKSEWFVLETHPEWREPKKLAEDRWDTESKRLWYQISSYLIQRTDLKKITDWGKDRNFFENHLPTPGNRSEVFYKEYYWSEAYKFFQNSYYSGDIRRPLYDYKMNKHIVDIFLTTNYYAWSEEFDCSKEEQINIMKPGKILWDGLQMKHDNKEGDYLNMKNELVCFDPSVWDNSHSCLVINKPALLKFLKTNDLCLCWIVLGEKQILGNKIKGYKENAACGFYSLNANGVFTGKFRPGISRGR